MCKFLSKLAYQLRKWSIFVVLLTLIVLFSGFKVWSRDETIIPSLMTAQAVQTATPSGQSPQVTSLQIHNTYLPMITLSTQAERPPALSIARSYAANHSGNSPEAPPEPDARTFVADAAGDLGFLSLPQ